VSKEEIALTESINIRETIDNERELDGKVMRFRVTEKELI